MEIKNTQEIKCNKNPFKLKPSFTQVVNFKKQEQPQRNYGNNPQTKKFLRT